MHARDSHTSFWSAQEGHLQRTKHDRRLETDCVCERESKDKLLWTGVPTSCDKNICRIVGAPACRVFPDHLIT